MCVGDNQLHPREAAGFQRPQERGPEGTIFAAPTLEAEDLALPVGGHPGSSDHGLEDDTVTGPRLAVGGIQEHMPERLPSQAPVPERRDLLIEFSADPADFTLADPRIGTQRLNQVIDLSGGSAVRSR